MKMIWYLAVIPIGLILSSCSDAPPLATSLLHVHISPEGAGLVFPDQGRFENNRTIEVRAIAAPDYEFVRWEGDFSGTDATYQWLVLEEAEVTAVFAPVETQSPGISRDSD